MSANTFAKLLFFLTLILIAAGGLVTSTDSGLSVPDWPLSFGRFFPPMLGGVRFEHTHRVIAMLVGIATLIFAIRILFGDPRGWMKVLSAGAVGAVVLQAVLGGLTVLRGLPEAVSVAHACLAQTFFALTAGFILFTSAAWSARHNAVPFDGASRLRSLCAALLGAAYFQLILGAVVRHADGAGVGFHVMGALIFVMFALFAASAASETRQTGLRRAAAALFCLVLIQVLLGVGSYVCTFSAHQAPQPALLEVFFTTAHQVTGALLLATSFLLLLMSFRFIQDPLA